MVDVYTSVVCSLRYSETILTTRFVFGFTFINSLQGITVPLANCLLFFSGLWLRYRTKVVVASSSSIAVGHKPSMIYVQWPSTSPDYQLSQFTLLVMMVRQALLGWICYSFFCWSDTCATSHPPHLWSYRWQYRSNTARQNKHAKPSSHLQRNIPRDMCKCSQRLALNVILTIRHGSRLLLSNVAWKIPNN